MAADSFSKPLTANTPITIGFVVVIVGAIIGCVVDYVRLRAGVEHLETQVAEVRAAEKLTREAQRNTDLRLQRAEDSYRLILDVLNELKTDVKQLRREQQ